MEFQTTHKGPVRQEEDPNQESYIGARETYKHEPASPMDHATEEGYNSYYVGTPKDPYLHQNQGAETPQKTMGMRTKVGKKNVIPTVFLNKNNSGLQGQGHPKQ